jgi:hypothetical protein
LNDSEVSGTRNEKVRYRFIRLWCDASLILMNIVVLFVLVNLACWIISAVQSNLQRESGDPIAPFKFKEFNEALAPVYPEMSPAVVTKLLHDTRRIPQQYEPYVQHRESFFQSKYVNVLPPGMRRTQNQGPWPPLKDEYRVFLFGGSTTFGYGVTDEQTIASHLQDVLRNQANIPARCYNFGRAYYTSTQERILFEQMLMQGLTPNLAIFIDGVNDFVRIDGLPPYSRDLEKCMREGDIPPFRRALSELPAVKTFQLVMAPKDGTGQSESGSNCSPQPANNILQAAVDRYALNKKIVETVCREFGVTVAFIWQPAPLHNYDRTHHIFQNWDYKRVTPYVEPGYQLMAKHKSSQQWGNDFIWLADMQSGEKKPLYVSGWHYSAEMSRMVAEELFKEMVNRNILPHH